jgi:hypothetical protein
VQEVLEEAQMASLELMEALLSLDLSFLLAVVEVALEATLVC